MIDLETLRVAVAISSASLAIALGIGWHYSRTQTFLAHGALGVAVVVIGLTAMTLMGGLYTPWYNLTPFCIVLVGLSGIYSATRRFRSESSSILPPVVAAVSSVALALAPAIVNLSGVSALMLNGASGVILLLCAFESWRARKESRLAITANAFIYTLTGISFLSCSYVILIEQSWYLTTIPKNWAEDFNTVMSLIGATTIGALTLTLHHARSAALHKDEANTDPLTGVLNRRALFNRLEAVPSCEGHAVIMFDLDHFKQVNDQFGHEYGDSVLRQFALVLKQHLRNEDPIARLGGEEFCVVVKIEGRDNVQQIADRIRRAFVALRIPGGPQGKFATVSIGLALGSPEETFPAALRRADAALYEAKRAGRNQVQIASLRLVA
ncbi:GGDEF domain-containing protein [Devosia sp. MC532]|uniref:GGDEF domain-containing protein n=1 Tax=Devosia sp. MC532 TaxID=2799788 RepID=UPI0018F37C6A|nr:GGDEF domain-containing protein [Devosia sp. MC532]MBJ7576909.1 GGDEF domain-containing protein [Devosia sp. MC532]